MSVMSNQEFRRQMSASRLAVPYPRMDPEAKKQWVEALRSGAYRQATGRLCRTRAGVDRFCCLGVAADLLADGFWEWGRESTPTATAPTGWVIHVDGEDRAEMLPARVLRLMHLSRDAERRLAELNDGGASFVQIAQWIEEFL